MRRGVRMLGMCYGILIPTIIQKSENPPLSEIVRGEYENKIRRFSPPEKVFNVFASLKTKDHLHMTLEDLLRALCFYNYCQSVPSVEISAPSIIAVLGKSTKFQIIDFYILARLVSMSQNDIDQLFPPGPKEINQDGYRKFLKSLVADYQNAVKQDLMLEPRSFKPISEQCNERIEQLAKVMFQKRWKLHKKQFITMKLNIIKEIYAYQFSRIRKSNLEEISSNTTVAKESTKKQGELKEQGASQAKQPQKVIRGGKSIEIIDGKDFARSIVKHIPSQKRKEYLQRILKESTFESIKINKEQYVAFHSYLSEELDLLVEMVGRRGVVSEEQLSRLIKTGRLRNITENQIRILISLLDKDGSGFIEKRQLVGVLEHIQYFAIHNKTPTVSELFHEEYQNFKNKLTRIIDIIRE